VAEKKRNDGTPPNPALLLSSLPKAVFAQGNNFVQQQKVDDVYEAAEVHATTSRRPE
jgi:hypothetical protein